jgi:cyanophycinase
MIKPLYLLADSQLLFGKRDGGSLPERIREDLDNDNPKAAYIGASNRDQPEFYSLFVAAMELMGVSNCRMVPTQPSGDDMLFIEGADLILLAGGDVERGWQAFEQNGIKDVVPRKRYDGAVLVGVSAGAVQLGLGALSSSAQPTQLQMFRLAPFYISAHNEKNDWWDLRALINLSPSDVRAIGIGSGGGAIYHPDGTLEPVHRPLTEFSKQDATIRESLLTPLAR